MNEQKKGNGKKYAIIAVICLALLAVVGSAAIIILRNASLSGYTDYTVQKEQYYVEYSDEYDYWDVLTVEYPEIADLQGMEASMQSQINQLLYDTAMDRVNYWHLKPSDDVKAFQEEHFSIFASDVNCDVTYHSQYLLSVDYKEYYSAGNPVWMTNGTERAVTVDLLTGQSYKPTDIFEINEDFVKLWDKSLSDDLGEECMDDEDVEFVLSWFLQTCEQTDYFFLPFFYITEDKEFVIGIAVDPVLNNAITYKPIERTFRTQLSSDELEAFKKPCDFWDKYEKSQTTGDILPCADKHNNIWLGEDAGVWDWEY